MANLEEIWSSLRDKNQVFQRLFSDAVVELSHLTPDEQSKAKEVFELEFPDTLFTLEYVVSQWIVKNVETTMNETPNLDETLCSKPVYDSGTKKYLKPQVLLNQRRKRNEKLDLGAFFRQKRSEGDFHQISLEDREFVEDLMDNLNDDVARNNQRADIALNRLVELAATCNNRLKYRLMELHAERRIH
ncbi:hypothetical protein JTE90_016311 [Oedothorax gibbosus]|uniref:Uncharacterized protein n=1 Tax=Oedothorax gibbosus TaxID=931172 RepID=A0AAV6TQK4_9ARAC|nr:hypothetical protein JTE90_016311 [Oedothorax gibbosus]